MNECLNINWENLKNMKRETEIPGSKYCYIEIIFDDDQTVTTIREVH